MAKYHFFLLIAIVFEVISTASLQASQQFTKPLPTFLVVVGAAGSFYFITLVLQFMPLGIVYAIWSGLGITMITAIGYFVYRQPIDFAAILGLSLIIGGIVVIQLYSSTATH